MDFGDFIALILFLVFFVAPFLKRKKRTKAQQTNKSKPSGFDVLGKIKEALEEAAKQAEQARKEESSGKSMHSRKRHESLFDQSEKKDQNQSFWDEIDDGEDEDFYPENVDAQVLEPIEPVNEAPVFVSTKKAPYRKATDRSETRGTRKREQHAMRGRCDRSGSRPLPAGARGLRKAVVWSEILGKPVALRESDSHCRY